MTTRPPHSVITLPADYGSLLTEIKLRVQTARIRAGLAANRELITLYWDIGRLILRAQQSQGYGKKVVERLAADVQSAFPGIAGFSPLNVWRMRAFYAAYAAEPSILSPAVTESDDKKIPSPPVTESGGGVPAVLPPEPFASLPWSHNLILLQKLEKTTDRLWYAVMAVKQGWSRDVLALQIESQLRNRQGSAITNFDATLPPPQSDLAQGMTKDPYLFDFLALRNNANERAVEEGLIRHVEKFLLELGAGFALVGRQVHVEVSGRDFYLDLLFYHLMLRCFVVIDLKAGEFTPEAAGKMNFYLSAVDERFKQPTDQPSIGLILCRGKDRVIAEYALRDLSKPIGVSDYVTRLVESLPEDMEGMVPSVAELEEALSDDVS